MTNLPYRYIVAQSTAKGENPLVLICGNPEQQGFR